jgi:beta-galactosidase
VRTVVVRTDGSVESELSASGTVAPGGTSVVSATATIANPHLWSGVAEPYVYQAYAEVRVGTTVTDWIKVPLGFRFYALTPAQGFSLNGHYLDLHGVNRHQDRLNMGWAIGAAQHDEDMALIRELGANVMRLRTTSTRRTSTISPITPASRFGGNSAGELDHRPQRSGATRLSR